MITDRLRDKSVIRAGIETLDASMLAFSLIRLSEYWVVLSRTQTYRLCTVGVRCSSPTDGIDIVPKGMEFVRREIELYLGTQPLSFVRSLALALSGSFASFPGIFLLWEFLGFKSIAELPPKVPEGGPKWFCEGIEGGQRVVSMEAKFGVCMPSHEEEDEIEDLIFVLLCWQKALNHRDNTL